MLEFFANVVWFIVWAVTLVFTAHSAAIIIHDREITENHYLIHFIATPVLWALIVVFFFN